MHISSERDFQGLHLDFFKVSQDYNVFGTFFSPGILLTQGCGPNYGLPEKGSTSITSDEVARICQSVILIMLRIMKTIQGQVTWQILEEQIWLGNSLKRLYEEKIKLLGEKSVPHAGLKAGSFANPPISQNPSQLFGGLCQMYRCPALA